MYPGFDSIIVLGGLALSNGAGINSSILLSKQALVPAPGGVSVDAGKLVVAVAFAGVGVVSGGILVDASGFVVAAEFAGVVVSPGRFSIDAGGVAVAVAFAGIDVNGSAVVKVAAVTYSVVDLILSLLLL